MKICAVTVWYNPQKLQKNLNAVNNIESYASYVDKVFVIDNSKNDNYELIKKAELNNVDYVPNFENLGIARALNIGFEKAKLEGYEYVMSMDQDSFWNKDELLKYFKRVESMLTESPSCCFGPNVREERIVSLYSEFKNKIKKILGIYKAPASKTYPDTEECLSVITSGNIVSLTEWESVGKFNEDFFIDQVDNEFCFRLLRSGKKVLKFNDVKLNHCLGEKRKTLFGRSMDYNGIRIYYIVRNSIVILKYYPDYAKGMDKIIKRLFLDSCVLNLKGIFNLRHFIKGIKDSKKIVIK